jgi:hypothetical protein
MVRIGIEASERIGLGCQSHDGAPNHVSAPDIASDRFMPVKSSALTGHSRVSAILAAGEFVFRRYS